MKYASEHCPSRRGFLQATAGSLMVSASLTAADTRADDATRPAGVTSSITGNVLRTRGRLSGNGQHLLEEQRAIPVAGTSDVLVCGGGPAGIGAALAAARTGVSVQLIEVAGCLGGVWTVGLLTKILDSENKSGIIAGRCISGDFVAHSSYRVTGNAVPMGEAAGLAAAISSQKKVMPHELHWREIRKA